MRRIFAVAAALAFLFSMTSSADHHENPVRELVKGYFTDVISGSNLDAIPNYIAEDYVNHSAPPDAPQGVEGVKAMAASYSVAFPDPEIRIEQIIVEGDKAVVYATVRAINSGPFMGMAATGKEIQIAFIDLFRVEDGKIAESWSAADEFTMMGQLGLMPAMSSGISLEDSTKPLHGIGESPMSTDEMKALAESIASDVWGADGADAIERLYADSYVNYSPGVAPAMSQGKAAVKMAVNMFRTGFPDMTGRIEDVVVEGDLIAARWSATGTHKGEFIVPATGKTVYAKGISFYRVKDGKVVAEWGIQDMAGLARQLGLTPEMGE